MAHLPSLPILRAFKSANGSHRIKSLVCARVSHPCQNTHFSTESFHLIVLGCKFHEMKETSGCNTEVKPWGWINRAGTLNPKHTVIVYQSRALRPLDKGAPGESRRLLQSFTAELGRNRDTYKCTHLHFFFWDNSFALQAGCSSFLHFYWCVPV